MSTPASELHLRLLLALAVVATMLSVASDWAWVALLPATGLVLASGAARVSAGSGRQGAAGPAVRAGLLRLLGPFWLFAVVTVALSVALGASSVADAWLWLVPLQEPSVAGIPSPWTGGLAVVPIWFWLLLLSPPVLWLARRWPLRVMVVPLLVLLPTSVGLVTVSGAAETVLVPLCAYAGCWVLGFLYADGRLVRIPGVAALGVGAAAVGAGLWVASVLGEESAVADVSDVPLAALLLGSGGVLVLLWAQPAAAGLRRFRRTAAMLRFLTDRVVTAVLWTGPALVAAPVLLDALGLDRRFEQPTAWLLLLLAVPLFGWAERPVAWRPSRRPRRYEFEGNVAAGQPVRDG